MSRRAARSSRASPSSSSSALPLLPEILGLAAPRLPRRADHALALAARRDADRSRPARSRSSTPRRPAASRSSPTPTPCSSIRRCFSRRSSPPAAAFNLHYLLHVLWAFFGARAPRAARSASPTDAAFFAGVAFAFSGMMLSYGSAFANSGAAASWLPWCAAATLDLVRARADDEAARAPRRRRRRSPSGCSFSPASRRSRS